MTFLPDGHAAYVSNIRAGTVSAIDPASGTVTATIKVGSQPAGSAATLDGTHLYVPNWTGDSVSVIDTASN
ncbi:MAG TPA: hypothetical protein VM690_01090, partial [Gaiellaceae bacterium]|nr:hypothetical protein [Gaiellaceae bacterium]